MFQKTGSTKAIGGSTKALPSVMKRRGSIDNVMSFFKVGDKKNEQGEDESPEKQETSARAESKPRKRSLLLQVSPRLASAILKLQAPR